MRQTSDQVREAGENAMSNIISCQRKPWLAAQRRALTSRLETGEQNRNGTTNCAVMTTDEKIRRRGAT